MALLLLIVINRCYSWEL